MRARQSDFGVALAAPGGVAGGAESRCREGAAGRTSSRITDPAGRFQWSSDQLFGNRHEIEIAHGDSVYRLRVTSLGKLILTK